MLVHDRLELGTMVKCPSCGVENLPNAERCRLCAKEIRSGFPQADIIQCPHCGSINPGDEMTCSICRRLLSTTVAAPRERFERVAVHIDEPVKYRSPRTRKPVLGGVLLLIAGLGTLAWFASYVFVDLVFADHEPLDYLLDHSEAVILVLLMQAVTISGGLAALRRRWWPLAVLGAVAGLTILPWADDLFLVFASMSFVALLLVLVSKAEFS